MNKLKAALELLLDNMSDTGLSQKQEVLIRREGKAIRHVERIQQRPNTAGHRVKREKATQTVCLQHLQREEDFSACEMTALSCFHLTERSTLAHLVTDVTSSPFTAGVGEKHTSVFRDLQTVQKAKGNPVSSL